MKYLAQQNIFVRVSSTHQNYGRLPFSSDFLLDTLKLGTQLKLGAFSPPEYSTATQFPSKYLRSDNDLVTPNDTNPPHLVVNWGLNKHTLYEVKLPRKALLTQPHHTHPRLENSYHQSRIYSKASKA